ncbi:GDSL-type esterase/lipase family protein [Enterovirga aerilata]|uniref:SGNH hydrolase-type esterase domain-containing protein n=1 Tax=Enterovirga aerilata TaxID=2730920 RepID=A0A849HW59_9HYPH|nr:GDSL-type esterase/lipase family protein [Enterovirga sp. DB1703]NNM71776.1 hypothetical protein [Enterovirga sp. DB1703]
MRRLSGLVLVMSAFAAGGAYGYGMGRFAWPPARSVDAFYRSLSPSLRPATWAERHFQERLGYFRSLPGTAQTVMLGDSHTERAHWDELLPDARPLNRGIEGDTWDGLVARLDEVVSRSPRRVFVLCGTNDVAAGIPPERIVAALATIHERLRAIGADLVVQSVPLTDSPSRNMRTQALNVALQDATKRLGLRYVDLNRALAPDGAILPHLTTDGVHLTGEAYRLWAGQVRDELGS